MQIKDKSVYLKDIAYLICTSEEIRHHLVHMRIFEFESDKDKKKVISVMYIHKLICETIKDPVEIHVIGAGVCLVEFYTENKDKPIAKILKTASVSCITFFGAAFSIMTYDQDAGVPEVFETLYRLFHVAENRQGILELFYAIGIGLGVFVFFHHFEKNEERTPTAMEIQMHQYEKDIVEAYVENAKRCGTSLEAEKR